MFTPEIHIVCSPAAAPQGCSPGMLPVPRDSDGMQECQVEQTVMWVSRASHGEAGTVCAVSSSDLQDLG